MFLNQTSHYALRAMTCLVKATGSAPVNSKELADFTDVPSHYLSKIMRKMVEAGYARSQKGHGGGFMMSIEPRKLRIMDVLVAAGFDMEEQPCVFGWEKCDNNKPCPLHPVWKRLKDCFNDWALNTTFEDIRKESTLIEEVKFYR
ncbi:MAG: Rrf2 family transcriptional regulator [Balneolaceae bacterium]